MDAAEIVSVFDRGSKAGRLLHSLYGGDAQGQTAGNEFSQRNRLAFLQRQQAGTAVAAPLPSGTRTKVGALSIVLFM